MPVVPNYDIDLDEDEDDSYGIKGQKWGVRKSQNSSDMVNNPQHYTQGDIECIDAIKSSMSKEAFKGFLKGNVIKYLWRYEKKDKPIEDLLKGEWYLKKLIEVARNTDA